MIQLTVILLSIVIAYIISLISGIHSIFKKEHYPISWGCVNLLLKAFSFEFINKLLNTTTRVERRNILRNLVVSEYGIFIEKKFFARIKATEIFAVVASMTCFSNLTIPKQTSLKKDEVQQIVKIPCDNTTHTFKI